MLSDFEAVDNVENMTDQLRRFLLGQPVDRSIPREQTVTPVNAHSGFAPESHLPSRSVPVNPGSRAVGVATAQLMVASQQQHPLKVVNQTARFPLSRFGSVVHTKVATIKEYPKGRIPLVSATAKDNGIATWLDIPDKHCHRYCMTVSLLHNTKPCQAFWHPYTFAALKGKAMVLKPVNLLIANPDAIIYLCEAVTVYNAWRYHYARSPRFEDLEVELPVLDGKPDITKMAQIVQDGLRIGEPGP